MSEQHEDFLDGLHVVETELERVIGELDEMYSRLGIHVLEVVSLWPLQWALNKLADDLHDADSELRNARLEVASARREASEARQQAEEMQGRHELQSVYSAGQAGRIVGLEGVVESLKAERDQLRERLAEIDRAVAEAMQAPTNAETLRRLRALDNKSFELSGNSGELPAGPVFTMEAFDRAVEFYNECLEQPAETAPEPYQWQVGDEVEHDGVVRTIRWASGGRGRLLIEHVPAHQQWFEAIGWKLHRKASDLPQQVAEFAAVTEPIDDSVGTDGEGRP